MATAKHKDILYATGIPRRESKLRETLDNGLPYEVYKNIASVSGLSRKDITKAVGISQSTLSRRSKAGRFNKDESDRLYGFVKVMDAAIDFFDGDREDAMDWLTHPVRGLDYRKPVDMLKTPEEKEQILTLIYRLEHGVCV